MITQLRINLQGRVVWIGVGLLAILAAASVSAGFMNALVHSMDYQWSPSRLLLMHHNPYAAYLDHVTRRIPQSAFLMTQFPNYPAYGLVFLWPFASLPWPVAQVTWAISNTLLGCGFVMLIHRLYFKDSGTWVSFFLLLFMLFASTPFRTTVGNGQHALFSLFFFMAAVQASNKDRPLLASMLLAISWLKYSVTFPLSLLFLRRDRILIAIFAVAIDLTVSGFVAIWTNSTLVDIIFQPFLVQRTTMAKGYLDVFDILSSLGAARFPAALLLSSLVVAGALWAVTRRGPKDELLLASTLSIAACIAIPHLIYDFVMFLFPIAYAIRVGTLKCPSGLTKVVGITFFAAVVPIWYIQRLVELFYQSHPGATSSFAVWSCWAWIVAGTYAAFGLSLFACLDPKPAVADSGWSPRAVGRGPVAAFRQLRLALHPAAWLRRERSAGTDATLSVSVRNHHGEEGRGSFNAGS